MALLAGQIGGAENSVGVLLSDDEVPRDLRAERAKEQHGYGEHIEVEGLGEPLGEDPPPALTTREPVPQEREHGSARPSGARAAPGQRPVRYHRATLLTRLGRSSTDLNGAMMLS